MEKCQKIRSSQNKVVEIRAERNVFVQLVLLSMKHDKDLELTLSFQLGLVPWALAAADGSSVLLYHPTNQLFKTVSLFVMAMRFYRQ